MYIIGNYIQYIIINCNGKEYKEENVYIYGVSQAALVVKNVGDFSSVARSCLTLCEPMDCSTPGFPVHHQLLELAQTHVYGVSDDI